MTEKTHLGNFSAAPPERSVHLECDRCQVSWTGCWDAFECPRCGCSEHFDRLMQIRFDTVPAVSDTFEPKPRQRLVMVYRKLDSRGLLVETCPT